MKILIIRTAGDVMNVSNYNSQELGLARAFASLGHQCDIVYFAGDSPDRVESVPSGGESVNIHWLRGKSVLKNAIFDSLEALLPKYDIIQTNGYDQYTSWKLYTSGRKNVTVYHGMYYDAFNKRYNLRNKAFDLLFMHRHTDRIRNTPCFTKSELAADFLKSRGFSDVRAVGVGFDVRRLEEGQASDEWVKRVCEGKNDGRYLLYIGQLEPRRNITFMLRAAAKAMQKDARVKLVIVGKGEKEYVDGCRKLADELGIRQNILYKESLPQSELKAIYTASDVFLLPTLYEIFGMVLLEAMYFGVPAITTYNGGSQMMIKSGENGVVLKAETDGDAEKWADAALEICAGKYPDMGKAASAVVREKFMWKPIAENMLGRYKLMLTGAPAKE